MTFSASGAIIQSPQRSTAAAIAPSSINSFSPDSEITVLEVWEQDKGLAAHDTSNESSNPPNKCSVPAKSQYSSLNTPSLLKHQSKRPLIYQGDLIQPRKRIRKDNKR